MPALADMICEAEFWRWIAAASRVRDLAHLPTLAPGAPGDPPNASAALAPSEV
jgi:hypothetical protein